MTQKRKSHLSGPHTPHSKRARVVGEDHETNGDAASKAQVDPTYGQRSAFPGLDDTAEEDALFYGPASDGLEYLRMVRSEAKGVPNLLTAAKPHTLDEQQNLYQDYPQGYYHDGAYVAASFAPAARNTHVDAEADIDPQEAYYTSLLTHFHALSSHLRSSPPSSQPNHPSATTTASDLNGAPLKKWRTTLLYTQPTTALLSHLSQEAIVNGVSALERYLDWRMLERGEYVGAWAWGLLARCRSVGMMGSEEVGVLRDLGKKARGMVRGMRAGFGGGEERDEEEGGEEDEAGGDGNRDDGRLKGNDSKDAPVEGRTAVSTPLASAGDEDDIKMAKQRLFAKLHQDSPSEPPDLPPQPKPNDETTTTSPPHPKEAAGQGPAPTSSTPPTGEGSSHPGPVALDVPGEDDEIPLTTRISATLDMIVTIVGEEYGQKDLLGGRETWD